MSDGREERGHHALSRHSAVEGSSEDEDESRLGERGAFARRVGFVFPGRRVSVKLGAVMRLIGHLETEEAARTVSDFLYVEGIESQVERDASDGWALWILCEDQIERASGVLQGYRQNPSDLSFKAKAIQAAKLRQQKEKDAAAYARKVKPRAEVLRSLTTAGFGPLTVTLIGMCLAVFALQSFNRRWELVLALTDLTGGLQAVLHGQVWRLLTPIFLHFGLLHIFFNLLWLRDLGAMIEGRLGSLRLGALVLGIALVSNLTQYLVNHYSFSGAEIFGGMSGVVYGLLGFIWMRGRFDPGSGLFLHPYTVVMMLVWAVVCLTGMMGPVANTVHFTGLAVGMAWGYFSSLRYR